jgi:hypothetical protein
MLSNVTDAGPAKSDESRGLAQLAAPVTWLAGSTGKSNTDELFDIDLSEFGSGVFSPRFDANNNLGSLASLPHDLLLPDLPSAMLAHPPSTSSSVLAVTTAPNLVAQELVGQPLELNDGNTGIGLTNISGFSDSFDHFPAAQVSQNQLGVGRGEILPTLPSSAPGEHPQDMMLPDWCTGFCPTTDSGATSAVCALTETDTCNTLWSPSSAKPQSQQAEQVPYFAKCFMMMIKVEHERIDLERRKLETRYT